MTITINLPTWTWVALAPIATVCAITGLVYLQHRIDKADSTMEALYNELEPRAGFVKSGLQMLIGTGAVITISSHAVAKWSHTADMTQLLIEDMGIALAAAAVVELAYTLFTPGPDEALDPLMLGLSSTILLQLNSAGPISLQKAGTLLIMSVILGGLFVVRLLLAEGKEGADPKIWWIKRLRSNSSKLLKPR